MSIKIKIVFFLLYALLVQAQNVNKMISEINATLLQEGIIGNDWTSNLSIINQELKKESFKISIGFDNVSTTLRDNYTNFDLEELNDYRYDVLKYKGYDGEMVQNPDIFVFKLKFGKNFTYHIESITIEDKVTALTTEDKYSVFKVYVSKENKEKVILLLEQLKK